MRINNENEECKSLPWNIVLRTSRLTIGDLEDLDDTEICEGLNDLNITSRCDFSDDENVTTDDETEVAAPRPQLSDLKLRNYQHELALAALQGQNCIICAPTGSGKTKVAIHIMLEHIKKNKFAKIAFLATTVSLANQQYEVIKKCLPASSKAFLLTGQSKDSMNLQAYIPSHTVAVLTPQILVNHLGVQVQGKEPLLKEGVSTFTMLVFDECHHTREGSPYNRVMYHYLQGKREGKKLPQVIGLTASICVEKANDLDSAKEAIKKICGNLDMHNFVVVKHNLEELKRFVHTPLEIDKPLERHESAIKSHILWIIFNCEKDLQEYARNLRDGDISSRMQKIPESKTQTNYLRWVTSLHIAAEQVKIVNPLLETNLNVRGILVTTKYLKAYHMALESLELIQVEEVTKYLQSYFSSLRENDSKTSQETSVLNYFEDLEQELHKHCHEPNPNLEILADCLKQYVVDKGPDGRALVFVRTLMLAEAVTNWLNRCGHPYIENLKAHKLTGCKKSEDQGGMTGAQQVEAVSKFRDGKVRILVATPLVAQEGLDIPECNATINYNQVGNEVAKVQTRGRCRATDGTSIVLGFEDALKLLAQNQHKEMLMHDAIDQISNTPSAEMRIFIDGYHKVLYQRWDLENEEEARKSNAGFTVFCPACRKISVHSTKMRTIQGRHYVSMDRNLLENIMLKPRKAERIDHYELIGCAICLGDPEPEKRCNYKLGTFIRYEGQPFVTFCAKYVKIQSDDDATLAGERKYRQWSKAPYRVAEMSFEDLMSYKAELLAASNEEDI